MLLLIIVLVLLFGGGGGYYGYSRWGTGWRNGYRWDGFAHCRAVVSVWRVTFVKVARTRLLCTR